MNTELGIWPVGGHYVELSHIDNQITANIRNSQGVVRIDPQSVYGGINGRTPHQVLIQKINALASNLISVFVYPQEHPSEVWVFEAKEMAALQINSATTEIEQTITRIKQENWLAKWKDACESYLPNENEVHRFHEVLTNYQDQENLLSSLETLLSVQTDFLPHHRLMSAIVHAEKGEYLSAMEDYLSLSENNPQDVACVEKAYALLEIASQQDKGLQIRIDGVRIAFEKSLSTLDPHPNTPPTCFICFDVEEKEVGQWLEDTLVPDLDRVGIKPLFCLPELSRGQVLDNFHELARQADKVIVVCTPAIKVKFDERKKAPTGVAQEISMIRGRYRDPDKSNTIFPIFPKDTQVPTAYFESIFGIKFSPFKSSSFEMNYFSNALDLLCALKENSREEFLTVRKQFLKEAKAILRGGVNLEEVQAWRASRQEKIQDLRKSIIQSVSEYTQMVNMPSPPAHFTGREEELTTLHTACQRQKRVAIAGLGGVGKTALALKYADQFKLDYQFVHFMPASSVQLAIAGLLKLADDLHVPRSDKPEERLSWLKVTLERLKKDYLLIFDGIDQEGIFNEIEKYLPDSGRCLLLTTRMPQDAKLLEFEIIELHPLTLEDAVKYLLTVTHSQDFQATEKLAEKLGRLPLALTHAARYMDSKKISIHKYIEHFDQYALKLFGNERLKLKPNEQTILTTWQISIHAIEQKENGFLAREILDIFAFLGQAPISLSLVEEWCKACHPEMSDLDLEDALNLLLEYSMIGSPQADNYAVHLLVQSVTRYQMPQKRQQTVFRQAVETLLSALGGFNKDDPTTWPPLKNNIPHAMTLVEAQLMAGIDLEKQWALFQILGNMYSVLGNAQQAVVLYQKSLEAAKQLFGEDDVHIALVYNNIGIVHQNLGENPQALEFFQKALDIQRQVYGENHPIVASSYNNIGTAYQNLGETAQSMKFLQKALEIRFQVYGENHPLVATSYSNIGMVYQILGENVQALEFLQKALKIQLQVCGENYPDVATSYNNIGSIYRSLGENALALEFSQQALKIRLRVYGENHPDVAKSYNNIAKIHLSDGENAQALEFSQQALQIRLRVYGENHPDVAICYSNIGTAYHHLGEHAQALEFHQKALKIKLQVYGENHPDVATSYSNIGTVYEILGENVLAMRFHQKALKIRLQAYGENHPDVAISYNNISAVYHSFGENAQAMELLQKALKIRLQVYGENHPDVGASYNNIGMVYHSFGEKAQALEFLQKALKIWLQVYGENHPDVARCYTNIGTTYHSHGKNPQALEFLEKALKIWLPVYGENHPDVAKSYNNIGMVYRNLGDKAQALEFLEKALKIRLHVYGENHPDVASSYSNIGMVYHSLGENAQALEFLQKALKILYNFYPNSLLEILACLKNIEDITG